MGTVRRTVGALHRSFACGGGARVEQLSSTDGVRHGALSTASRHLPERLRRCETALEDTVRLRLVEEYQALQPTPGFVERAANV